MKVLQQLARLLAGADSLSVRMSDPRFFQDGLSPEDQRRLFHDTVWLVEMEPSGYCNRNCRFCLNSRMVRCRNTFPDDLHRKVLNELAEIAYAGTIQYARYCEPLADNRLIHFLRSARKVVPAATLKIITNGDFLTPPVLDELTKAGLDILAVSLYLSEGTQWSHSGARERIRQFANRLGLDCRFRKPHRFGIFADFAVSGLRLDARCLDFGPGKEGFDRGGGVPELGEPSYVRRDPCPFVFHNFTLDWNGNFMPCCNLHSDFAPHRQFILGNVEEQSIFGLFTGTPAMAWRRRLMDFREKTGVCRHCRDAMVKSWRDRLSLSLANK